MRWFWKSADDHQSELQEMDERLNKIEEDDKKVQQLGARVEKILRENSLAPAIMRALRMQR